MNKLIVPGLGFTSCWQLGAAASLLWLRFMALSASCYIAVFETLTEAQRGWCPIISGDLSTSPLRLHFIAAVMCGNGSFILESSSRKIPQHRAGESDNLGGPAHRATMLNKEPRSGLGGKMEPLSLMASLL